MTLAALLHPFLLGLATAVLVAVGWHRSLFGLPREPSQMVVAGVFSYVLYYCVLMALAFAAERIARPFRWTKVALICSLIAAVIPVAPYSFYAFEAGRKGSGHLGWSHATTWTVMASLPGIFVTDALESEFGTGR